NLHETLYGYDELNRLLSTADALNGVTSTTYDALGNRLTARDANGHTTLYRYDALNRLVETVDPLGNRWRTEYDALGNVIATVDANGNRTTFEYDILNRLVRQTDALGGVTRTTYDAVGNQLTVSDANGHTTTTAYDALNRPISVTDANGNATTTTYDEVGDVIATTDGLGSTTRYAYDELNRLVSQTDPLGNITRYAYDAVGNRRDSIDAAGAVTHFEYDDLNRLTAVLENYRPGFLTNAETNVRTEYSYDAVGNRLTIRDGKGNVTRFEYDELNRLEREVDPLGNATAYTYDAVGNRLSLSDAAGFTTSYGYDEANRLLTIDYPAPDPDVTFTYDALGNRATMQDGVGTTVWSAYDALNRVLAVTDPFGGTVRYSYDRVGNRTRLTYPDGKVVSYAYDPADRLIRVTDWDGQATSYTYDAADQLASIGRPNGVATGAAYDPAGRLLELRHTRGEELLSSFAYRYDAVGNRAQAVEIVRQPAIAPVGPYRVYLPLVMAGGPGSDGGLRIDYRYDALYRLTAADYTSGEIFHYSYDAVGNRLTQETRKGINRYVYDAANRLTSVDPAQNGGANGGVAFVWDANGNLLSDGVSAYTYDHANRLSSTVHGPTSYAFTYNGLGDRLRQTVDPAQNGGANGGVATSYALDLNAGLTQVLADGANTYLYGLGRIGEEQPGGWQYHLGDALGSVRQLADSSASITLARSYEPFGSVLSSNGDASTAYGFTGEWTDATGLVHLRARYLDPALARFLTRDAWAGASTSPATLHRYAYAHNNPLLNTDPSGLLCVAGFSWGPGRSCTPEEIEHWARNYQAAADLFGTLGGATTQATANFAAGFFREFVDVLAVIPVISLSRCLIESIRGSEYTYSQFLNERNPYYNAGRWIGRGTAAAMGAAEIGLALVGVGGGTTISLSGIGAAIGIPTLAGSIALGGHGALVLVAVAGHNTLDPLPPLVYAATGGGGGGSSYGTRAEREALARRVASETGGTEALAQGDGWRVTIPRAAPGRRNIVIRIMNSGGVRGEPYFRVSVDGKGALALDGSWSSSPLLTHHALTPDSLDIIKRLVQIARIK
ncbi:MAG TPA: RHS repeat-associated core domain-containing protein, partial [Anaerolineales bacterium]|nr:RHS repeat-associated core domain-containing protein [Anaerolineales bacterium]